MAASDMSTVEVDIEPLVTSDGSRCEAVMGIPGTLEFACTARAYVLVLVKCPEHGVKRFPMCRLHFWMLRIGNAPRCNRCFRRSRWVGGGDKGSRY